MSEVASKHTACAEPSKKAEYYESFGYNSPSYERIVATAETTDVRRITLMSLHDQLAFRYDLHYMGDS